MEKRTGISDHPTLEELECLIMRPKGTKGYNAEAIVLQQLYGFCLVHGFGRVFQMIDAMYDIWLHPEDLPEYQQTQHEQLEAIDKGIKVYNDDLPFPNPIEARIDVRLTDENRRIREENKAIREHNRSQADHNQQQLLHNLNQSVENQGQALDNRGQALDNQGQAKDNQETREANRRGDGQANRRGNTQSFEDQGQAIKDTREANRRDNKDRRDQPGSADQGKKT
jgi:hypothetical protein